MSSMPPIYKGMTKDERAAALGNELLGRHKFISTGAKRPTLWVYDPSSGIWRDDGFVIVREVCTEMLEKYLSGHSSNVIRETASFIHGKVHKDISVFNALPYRITLKNGVYDLEKGTFNPEFCPHEYHTQAIPVNFDPKASCPNIDRFLESSVPDSVQRLAIFEHLGHSLVKDYTVHKMFFMLGGGGWNGKSTLCNLVKIFLGPENCNSASPRQLSENVFDMASLRGRLANIVGDVEDNEIPHASALKKICGKDEIHAGKKYKDASDFMNYSKFWWGMNQVPRVYDDTDAFYRRVHFIDFPNSFPPGAKKTIRPDILDASISTPEELSGLFNHAIAGWVRLQKQGEYSGTLSVKDTRIIYAKESDPIQLLALLHLKPHATDTITKDFIFEVYVEMCEEKRLQKKDKANFHKELQKVCPWLRSKRKTIDGRQIGHYVGVEFGPPFESVSNEEATHEGYKPTADEVEKMRHYVPMEPDEKHRPTKEEIGKKG